MRLRNIISSIVPLFFCITMYYGATFLYRNGWYNEENINGIIVEIHGALIDIFIIAAIYSWHKSVTTSKTKKPVLDIFHVELYRSLLKSFDLITLKVCITSKSHEHFISFGNQRHMEIIIPDDYREIIYGRHKLLFKDIKEYRRRFCESLTSVKEILINNLQIATEIADEQLQASILKILQGIEDCSYRCGADPLTPMNIEISDITNSISLISSYIKDTIKMVESKADLKTEGSLLREKIKEVRDKIERLKYTQSN